MTGIVYYPNREHANADKAAKRRALKALTDITEHAQLIRRRIEIGDACGDDSQPIAASVRDLTQHLATLGALRDVREWHEADIAEPATRRVYTHDAEGAIIAVDSAGESRS